MNSTVDDQLTTLALVARLREDLGREYDRHTITAWTRRENNPLPIAYQGRPGQSNKYNYDVFLDWLAEEDQRQNQDRRPEAEIIDWHEARTRDMAARAIRSELETEQMARNLGDRSVMRLEVEDLGRRAIDKLLTLSDRLAAILVDMTDETAISATIDTEVREIANEIGDLIDKMVTPDSLDHELPR